MSILRQFVVFRLDQQRYALPLAIVERVTRAVEVMPLPHAPSIVLGAANIHGRVLPVLNVRRRFLLPDRDIRPADWFLLAHTPTRMVVLVVDEAQGVIERAEADIVAAATIAPALDYFPGVIRLDDGLVLIHDLDKFLSLDEARALSEATHEAPRT
jgi:purine-binding chemotaxis protein CheW